MTDHKWMNFHFRRAIVAEQKDVEKLVRVCGKHVRDYFDMRNKDEYWTQGEVWGGWTLKDGKDVECIAFAVVHALKREPVLSLYDVGVHPEWRGLHVATMLMSTIWMAYPEARAIRLVVSEGNKDAIAMYERWGLAFIERRETRRNGFALAYEGRPEWS